MFRLLLIFSLFFSSSMDACLAEDLLRSTASAAGMQVFEKCSSIDDCSASSPDEHESHDHHGSQDSCQHCHSCHVWVVNGDSNTKLAQLTSERFNRYSYYVPTPFYKSLKRPPKV